MMGTIGIERTAAAQGVAVGPSEAPRAAAAGEAPPSLLPPPFTELASSGDLGAELAALLLEAARDQKEAARETRAAAESAQRAAETAELDAMKAEASAKLIGGLLEGGGKMLGGAIGLAGAGAESTGQLRAKGGAALTEGFGRAGGAIATHAADASKRAAVEAGQLASRDKRAADDARDLGRDASEMLGRALGYYKEYLTAKSDTQKAALFRA